MSRSILALIRCSNSKFLKIDLSEKRKITRSTENGDFQLKGAKWEKKVLKSKRKVRFSQEENFWRREHSTSVVISHFF